MSRLLRNIKDWPERIGRAKWCVAILAKECKVSISTLERYFKETMLKTPHEWMNEEFMRPAREFLAKGLSVKETANELDYNQHHFSLAFKKHHGYPPSEHRKRMADPKMMEDGGDRRLPKVGHVTPCEPSPSLPLRLDRGEGGQGDLSSSESATRNAGRRNNARTMAI